MRHHAERVSDGGSGAGDDHIWVAVRRLLEWRADLSGTSIYRARDLLAQAASLAEETA